MPREKDTASSSIVSGLTWSSIDPWSTIPVANILPTVISGRWLISISHKAHILAFSIQCACCDIRNCCDIAQSITNSECKCRLYYQFYFETNCLICSSFWNIGYTSILLNGTIFHPTNHFSFRVMKVHVLIIDEIQTQHTGHTNYNILLHIYSFIICGKCVKRKYLLTFLFCRY